jgi:WD40 repeat protein
MKYIRLSSVYLSCLLASLILSPLCAVASELAPEVVPNVQPDLLDGGGVVGATSAFSPRGTVYVTATSTSIELRDVKSGRLIKVIQDGAKSPVAFSPDGKTLLYSLNDEKIAIMDLIDGRVTGTFGGVHEYLNSIRFSPDGRAVLTSDSKGSRLWDASSGHLIRSTTVDCCWSTATFSAKGKIALINWNDPESRGKIWDLETGRILQAYDAAPLCFITFRNDDAIVFGGTTRRIIMIVTR